MSRVGRSPVTLPKGVEATAGSDGVIDVKGPKGALKVQVDPSLDINVDSGVMNISRSGDSRTERAQHGLARALIANAVTGVSEGFVKNLEIHGVGFRCQVKGQNLELSLGFSHTIVVEPPAGITIAAPEPTRITITGIDKQAVGQVAANIRAFRPPDAYHGKGVRYAGEVVRLKPGKTAAR
ncbi:MAG TPA: 50S ribosomal protein L6 [Trueperaceae bacterium]|nr:50S ribosomal protein L6 [Trueperaceae bacterium]